MEVKDWPLNQIKPYAHNPRKRSKKAIAKVAASIREFGVRQPIVVDEAGEILVGHTRRDAAEELGMATFPVHQALGLTDHQKRAYRIADNRTNEETEWDDDILSYELKGLDGFDLSLTGFELRQVNGYTRGGPVDGEDDVPEPGEPVTQPGDLWVMGEHRLLCGDATSAADVARLLDREKPFLMVTDPPYGVEYDPTWRDGKGGFSTAPVLQRGVTTNDDRADWSEAWALFPGSVAYVWHASLFTGLVMGSLVSAVLEPRAQIIWRKQQALFSRGAYHWQHEPCWYAVRKGSSAGWIGDRKQSTVWDIQNLNPTGNRKEERVGHGAQKPVECMRRPIQNHSGDVYDPFSGSGSTLIAAQTEGRRCYGLEIEPRYCDIIRARWEKFTSKTAVLERAKAAA